RRRTSSTDRCAYSRREPVIGREVRSVSSRNTLERLRSETDEELAGDKVRAFDPAAAPLGVDEEAAGTPVLREAIARARANENRRGHRVPHGFGHAWILVLFVVAFAAILIGWRLLGGFLRKMLMKFFATLIAITVIAASAPVASLAQAPATSPTAPVTGMKPDRTTADTATHKVMRAKEAALRAKRSDCRKQARQQKVPLLKRRAFVKACMSR